MPSEISVTAPIRWGRTLAVGGALAALAVGAVMWWLPPGDPPAPTPGEGKHAPPPGRSRAPALAGTLGVFDGADARRPQLALSLTSVGQFERPTDIQFAPDGLMIVLQKGGEAFWRDLATGKQGKWFELDVLTRSEQGLLGLAFHPKYTENGKLYTNAVVKKSGAAVTRVQAWQMPVGADIRATAPRPGPILFEVPQPYANHNAGQVAFGPDGYLYVGFGDGGAGDDPHDHGQNTQTFLSSMIRIDVDRPTGGKPYGVPPDNPFVGDARYRPEMWAIGLRNPWRYSFTPDGRLICGDVGQNKWEEITFVPKGGNLGWRLREADHCFNPAEGCPTEGLTDPIYAYGRREGRSVTGGHVYTGARIGALKGKYVFGDFATGRLWALDLPEGDQRVEQATALGRWSINPVAFGRDASGELYVADFSGGKVLKLGQR